MLSNKNVLKTLLLFFFKMSPKLFFHFELINWGFSLQGRGFLNEENRSLSGCYTPKTSTHEERAARKRKAVSEPVSSKRKCRENRVSKTKLSLLHTKRTVKLNVLVNEEMNFFNNIFVIFLQDVLKVRRYNSSSKLLRWEQNNNLQILTNALLYISNQESCANFVSTDFSQKKEIKTWRQQA